MVVTDIYFSDTHFIQFMQMNCFLTYKYHWWKWGLYR